MKEHNLKSNLQSIIESLVDQPREALNIELKEWIDPVVPEAKAKIIKAMMALHNQNGGFLLIGFKNQPPERSINGVPADSRDIFSQDAMQMLASNFSTRAFEVEVHFVSRDGIDYPVIYCPPGVRSPVACKRDLLGSDKKKLLAEHTIYARTLSQNGMVSTAPVRGSDLEELIQRCFENREADVSRFLTSLVRSLDADSSRKFMEGLVAVANAAEASSLTGRTFLDVGDERLNKRLAEEARELSAFGVWEAAFVIQGEFPANTANSRFLETINRANPNLTARPIGRVVQQSGQSPHVLNETWEALWVSNRSPQSEGWLEFAIFNPTGRFFFARCFEDDILDVPGSPTPLKCFDPTIAVWRTAEAMFVGQAFAKALKVRPETSLAFAFRWKGLKSRALTSWTSPLMRGPTEGAISAQDEVVSAVDIQVDSNPEVIANAVHRAVLPVTRCFHGFEIDFVRVKREVENLFYRRQ
jgi:hypothetical protein